MRIAVACASIVVALFLASPAMTADETQADEPRTELSPVPEMSEIEEYRLIHADTMTLTRQQGKPQVFQGAVHIVLVDTKGEQTHIEAEKITIYYDQSQKKIEKIEAETRVRIRRLDTIATTDLAVYRGPKNIIELLIDPHVKDSRGELSANKITVLLDANEVVAEGNVRGVVHPAALEEAKGK